MMNKAEKEDWKQALDDKMRDMKNFIATLPLLANALFTVFTALKDEGFTDEQALEIVKARGARLI